MSADNAVYVLRFSDDTFRVRMISSPDDLWWWKNKNRQGEINPLRILERYDSAKSLSEKEAYRKAQELEDDMGETEYGIVTLRFRDTWDTIVQEAQYVAKEELEQLKKEGKGSSDYEVKLILNLSKKYGWGLS